MVYLMDSSTAFFVSLLYFQIIKQKNRSSDADYKKLRFKTVDMGVKYKHFKIKLNREENAIIFVLLKVQ